ncbi:MAG TPA: FlgO family outer membrane protein [Humidesulfovibrio sp.]|uniref:FlgO family outer membrane protein n=1 Tax=Humidesulfovibrio sp. TaxID=2910988 RepID=UPI002BFEC5C4|nr:FlgO family outer membrane protein [Humidesulfovibrio sp.]HWR03861.1 FlgO family outer membrane protein [Humidesulfovibrio sp.]
MNARRHIIAPLVLLTFLTGAAGLLSGCGSSSTSYYSTLKRTAVDAKDDILGTRPTTGELFKDDNTPLTDISYDAADTMMGMFMPALNKNSPIYVEPFTNRVNMGDPSPFGPLVSEQVAARLAMRSFKVTLGQPRKAAPKPAPEQPDKPEGLALSGAEAKAADKRTWEAQNEARPSLLSGTYLIADKVIYVSARIVALDDGQVLAAHTWTVPVNRNTRAMLPQLKQSGGMTPSVRTQLNGNAHKIANPSGQPQNYVERDLVR